MARAGVVSLLALIVTAAVPAARGAKPPAIPALQSWSPSAGSWQPPAAPRVVVARRDWRALRGEARTLAADLGALLDRRVAVARGAQRRGDIVLSMRAADPQLGREGYELRVGRVLSIAAPRAAGVFYGGRTVLQLLHRARSIPAGSARDWPRYPERGLMLDAARTAYTRAFIERQVDRIAYLKLNVLHLHLTDDQRWGIASDMEPGLTARDALSKADIRAILARAARDHVLVIPELDMPGHSAALLAHHPALELRPAAIYSSPAPAQYLTDKLDITNPATFALVRRLIEEYLPLFPGRYFDLGADEFISPAEYAIFPQLATYAIATYGPGATPGDAIHGFINRVDALVRAHGKTLRVWNDQLGLGGVVPVAADVVVDWWIDVSPLGDTRTIDPGTLLGQGHAVLNGGWFPTYYATDLGPIEGRSNMRQAYEDWSVAQFCGPELTGDVRADPCSAVGPASRGLLGSQLNVWGPLPETPTQTEAGIWPRLAVIAQKTWDSPPSAASYAGFTALLGRLGSPR